VPQISAGAASTVALALALSAGTALADSPDEVMHIPEFPICGLMFEPDLAVVEDEAGIDEDAPSLPYPEHLLHANLGHVLVRVRAVITDAGIITAVSSVHSEPLPQYSEFVETVLQFLRYTGVRELPLGLAYDHASNPQGVPQGVLVPAIHRPVARARILEIIFENLGAVQHIHGRWVSAES
jgi:hypothetical protein